MRKRAPLAARQTSLPTGSAAPAAARWGPKALYRRPRGSEAERRLVSVLFADLVGFTTLSESRDAEEVRELLSRYFDTARQVIGRYGGTVEKFIGDAVMAVWGTPVAQEDDAERAVRAALDLVSEVAVLGSELSAPKLRLRAGVVTGEAAVTIGAEGQGMVAGDLVNTTARVQSAAQPGTVLVGETTRRMTEAAIAYEDAGEHELKGKAEPVHLWRPVRIVAGLGGDLRWHGLEAPFVGREPEFRLLRNLFHETADERKARLVSVVGVAGIGKSRLAWEFEKYIDGLIDDTWWHRGRCLPYGEGVAYWALAEVVRMRADILEDEDSASARGKLRVCLEEHVSDPEERAWIEPRLAHLLGLAERVAPDREDLFSAWRLFFERLVEEAPTVLLFEDLHWADASLLDFVEYLLEWSRNHPIFVLTLGRPELLERRPNWGASTRSFHSLFLEPLPETARDELLLGLVPGLPEELRARIRERAEGVPLYAVETVRMLLDRGLLARTEDGYALTGPVEALEVPETLHALIAARLDGLDAAERRLLEDGSVLGRTFTGSGLAAISGLAEQELEPLLASLVRKEILTVEADPRSPERGQYGFLHGLVQRIAYDTLSKRERKTRHLAVAGYLEAEWGHDDVDIVEVVASHYLEAYRAAPDAEDAAEIKARASERLARAAERAASLAANEEAERYFEQAAELAQAPLRKAELRESAGQAARAAARLEAAEVHFAKAIAVFEEMGETHPAARVSARLGEVVWRRGRLGEALERMEQSFQVLSRDQPDEAVAAIASQLGKLACYSGHFDLAAERIELALDIAESLGLAEVISEALNTKALIIRKRRRESLALFEGALRIALESDLTTAALRAYHNLAECLFELDQYEEALIKAREGLALARRRGDRTWEWGLLAMMGNPLFFTGEWDEVGARIAEVPEEVRDEPSNSRNWHEFLVPLARIHAARGEAEDAARLLSALAALADSSDLDERTIYEVGLAVVRRCEGRHAEAIAAGERAMEIASRLGGDRDAMEGMIEATEAAFALGDLDKVASLLEWSGGIPVGERILYLGAQEARFKARLGIEQRDTSAVEPLFRAAAGHFRELRMPFPLAVSLLEQGEWLAGEGRAAEGEALLSEAREIFERLKARPWLERLERAGIGAEVVA